MAAIIRPGRSAAVGAVKWAPARVSCCLARLIRVPMVASEVP